MIDDELLLDFDRNPELWADENERTSRTALAEHPEVYRNQPLGQETQHGGGQADASWV
jgi:hypothetical protein